MLVSCLFAFQSEEARLAKELEAQEKRMRKELEKQDILRRKVLLAAGRDQVFLTYMFILYVKLCMWITKCLLCLREKNK